MKLIMLMKLRFVHNFVDYIYLEFLEEILDFIRYASNTTCDINCIMTFQKASLI